ncbi:major capsid protein [Octadecabacter Antarctic DB virus 2]|nr:major capsid protein [Octadecabacter Antarctic DB virus 2]
MAQPANTFDSYDANGIREDLSDTIYDISPEETPFYSGMAKVKATATLHEYQTDALRSSAANAHIEGDDTAAEARTATTRLGARTQIFKNAVVIPGTDVGLSKAGRAKEMAYNVLRIAKEQKLDIEKSFFANNAAVTGNSSTARELAGAPAWLTTNVLFGANEGASPTGDGTDARTDETTTLIDFSQARFDSVMQSVWTAGGKPDTVYLSAYQMNIALGFTGNNNQRANIEATKGEVRNAMAVYVTPWGAVTFVPTRENRSRDIFVMQNDMWCSAVLRATKNEALAKTGDNEKRQVVTELTLVCKNEAASGGLFDNAIS